MKREISRCNVRCFIRSIETNSRLRKQILLAAWDQGLLESSCHIFRHRQLCCSSCGRMLLTCLEDIPQNYPSYCSSYIPETRIIVLFLKAMASEQATSIRWKIFRLVVQKKASALSTLRGIANCIKNRTARKIMSSKQFQHLAAVLPTTTFDEVWESCSQQF